MEKSKRDVNLGVQRKKKKSKKSVLKNVVDYLKSSSYMFAPLVKSPSKQYSAFTVEAVELKKLPIEKGNKVVGYLKSDSYMYAALPLCDTQPISPPQSKGTIKFVKRVTVEVSTRTLTQKCPAVPAKNVIAEDLSSNKKMVYGNCRPGSGILDSRIRKLLVD